MNGFAIVSKDSDFFDRSVLLGAPPKVIWVRLGNCRTNEVDRVMRAGALSVRRFLEDEQETCLLLGWG